MLSYESIKAIEGVLGAEKAQPIIEVLQEIFKRIDDQKVAIKTDLLLELATKADIARLEGKLETEVAKINGELKSLRLWMKLLVTVGIIGTSFFSPTTIKLLEWLK